MHRLYLHLLMFLSLSVPSWAQTDSYEPTSLLSQASIHQWTGDNGLISNNITSSIQAKTGFIWITTYNGIIRFDGKNVEVFDRNNLPFLSTDAFYRVYEDNKGTLWFASQGSGVVKFDGKKFIPIDSAKKVLPKSIRCLYIEDNGSVWVGSNNEGLFKIDGDSLYRVDNTLFNSSTISDLAKDNSNTMWIGTEGNGVVKYDGTQFEHFTTEQGLLSNSINTLSVSNDKQIFIGT
jgi:ligand-binding sensor domain-containing protein